MVAVIKIKNALTNNFYYNENKVSQGVATCLMACNYSEELDGMTPAMRLKTLQKTASQNEAVKVNSVHISLNFDPTERLSEERLRAIASTYMERIGFGKQPYLVYQHFDAGHPHIHLLTVKVDADGYNIDTHNIGKRLSEPARKEIETSFNLVRAEDQIRKKYNLKPAYSPTATYGQTETKRAIANVLEAVLTSYNFTSLPELNAVLGQYNVNASRGNEDSRIYKLGGLIYRILDKQGNPVGVPIKASLFHNKPTLKFLESRFKSNETTRLPLRRRVKNEIDLYFLQHRSATLKGFQNALEQQGIDVVLRKNKDGLVYGMTYIDHKNRAVFNGSDLGKEYSAKAITERFGTVNQQLQHNRSLNDQAFAGDEEQSHTAIGSLVEDLVSPEHTADYTPYELSAKKRKKKKHKPNKGPRI